MKFNIIKAEFYKIIKSRLCTVLIVVLSVPIVWSAFQISEKLLALIDVESTIPQGIQGCDAIINNSCYNLLSFIMPVLINFVFTSEFDKKTIRNIVLKTSERKKAIFGKIIFFFLLLLCLNLILGVISTVLCTVCNGWGEQDVALTLLKDFIVVLKMSVYMLATNYLVIPLALIIANETIVTVSYFAIGVGKVAVELFVALIDNGIFNCLKPFLLNECEQYMISFETVTVQCALAMVVRIAFIFFISQLIMKKKEL